jgi:hypothetical protein
MTTATADLYALISALTHAPRMPTIQTRAGTGNALFVGSGDSLSACLLAERAGQRAASAGDIAWTGHIPPRVDTVVGVSNSGRTTATVEAVRTARDAGLRTIAVTARPGSALARTADDVVLVPGLEFTETIPATGYLVLALGVLALLGVDTDGGMPLIGRDLAAIARSQTGTLRGLPGNPPAAISVLTLPDLRSAGDFWSLKLIEATGLSARSVALEESGHVDFFVGPQDHLTLDLIAADAPARHARLAGALTENGHVVLEFPTTAILTDADAWQHQLAVAAFGAYLAQTCADRWGRIPFRNGDVNMDAQHIQIPT